MTDPISQTPATREMSDHDLLIRIDERTSTLGRNDTDLAKVIAEQGKRLQDVEDWKANQDGRQAVLIRTATLISSVVSTIISGVIVGVILTVLKSR